MVTPMNEWDLKLGHQILNCCRHNGFLSAITKAERGYGKSCYNIKIMAYVYYHLLGCSEQEAWKQALESIVFTPDAFISRIKDNLSQGVISPCICIDDATVHFSSYLYFINLYETSLLNATFDTIRVASHSILINCPDKHRLLPGLRHYDDYEITLYKEQSVDGYQRKAVGIKWYSLPSGTRQFRKMFEDHFSCYIPNSVYNPYMELRTKYLEDVSNELEELMKKLNRKKQKKLNTT